MNASTELSFGEWLKLKRKALDLTREELAERVGYSAATIRKIEDEERHPSAQVVERLAEVLKIPQNERTDFLRFARGDLKSAPAETDEDRPWRASSKSPRSNIPATTTSLIGREKEIADVRKYLAQDDIRLVTLLGPPGIGKTRLSIECARVSISDFADGIFFVTLASLDDPSHIAPAISQALGFVGLTNISTVEQLKEGIGEKQILLVLDNCEHLIEDVSSLASGLLSTCSRLKILATSRESFRILGEWLYPVPAFDLPNERSFINMESLSEFPALILFAERARAVRPDFVLNADNIQTVATICAHLDGLPLVIELIAARMRFMSPESLLERLNEQFILSADGLRAASTRQKTLNDAICWSYNLLSEEEQKLFAYLSVFSGGFTLDMAEAIFSRAASEKSISNLIASLLDKSLLQLGIAREGRSEARYSMLVTIQEFARNRLRKIGEETKIRNWHLAYFLDLTKNANQELRGPNQLDWLRRLGAEVDNLRASLDWAIETRQTELALRLVTRLDWFWFIRADHNEGRYWLRNALEMPDVSSYPEAQAEALTQLAHHIWLQTGEKDARPLVEQALSIVRTGADKHNTARALSILGLVLIVEADFVGAETALEESKGLFQEVRDTWGYAHAVTCHALAARYQGDWTTVDALSKQGLALFREVGDRYFESVSLRDMGIRLVQQGNITHAMALLRESLILAQQLDSKYEIAAVLRRLGEAEQRAGNPARAVVLYSAARNVFDSIGVRTLLFENDLAPRRAALSETEFGIAMEQGRAMTMEQAIAYALEDHDN